MEFLAVLGSALWLGILTSISPCPLATNIAAVSFISRTIMHPARVFISGLAYTMGRMVVYAGLGLLVIHSFLGVSQAAQFLQKYIVMALGPLLIIAGLIVLEVIPLNIPGITLSQKHQARLVESGVPGAFALGFLFALAFCPVSAALFFGSLIPLAFNSKAAALLPFMYGIGTGLPVLISAVAIALGVSSMGRWFRRIKKLEYYTRRITGIIFILAGLYYAGMFMVSVL